MSKPAQSRLWGALGWTAITALGLVAGFAAMQDRFLIGVNVTGSLPQRVFLIDRAVKPTRGDFVAFRFEGADPLRHGRIFVKVLLGMPGDEVKQRSRQFTVIEEAASHAHQLGVNDPVDAVGTVNDIASAGSAVSAGSAGSADSAGSAASADPVDRDGRTDHRASARRHEHFAGQAKTIGLDGQALQPGPTGVLPAGRFYVYAPHPDSLDSRYALTGWIHQRQIIGRAHALF
jgi:conjugal transfer pilin signal peptidase TrbI